MRYSFLAVSILTGVAGCMTFQVGGFLLFPVALDLWDRATDAPAQRSLASTHVRPHR